ncbi:MAG: serine/threonine protein kinase, partial [Deltaproteobacteria bacterium]|nr:serine/threonine protein kinase [Deltaproteobacteria bacterium]
MFLLPHKVGDYTLHRKLGTGGVAESYLGTSGQGASSATGSGKAVVVRRILPFVLRDAGRLSAIEGRVRDLIGVRHPYLVHVLEHVVEGDEHFLVEEYVDGVTLEQVLNWCRQSGHQIPHNVFLNIATQICNGLEALHGRSGKGSASEHVLHYALKPSAIFLTREGKVLVGSYGLARSPTSFPHGGVSAPVPARMEYLSPEQTHPDQKLTPASDIFSLGACLYEVLTLESLFRAESNLQTIHKVRRAEVTSHLLRVKERMPGLDKVLFRALSLNPRHRYQRAFVLREDLRGLMAGYSFASINEDTRSFLGPLLEGHAAHGAGAPVTGGGYVAGIESAPDAPQGSDAFDDSPATRIDPDPMATAAVAAQALAERVAKERADAPASASEESSAASGEKTEWTQTHEGSLTPLPPLEALNPGTPPDSTAAYIARGASGIDTPEPAPPPSPPT